MKISLSIILLLIAVSASATSYFVANGGNDANNGTTSGTPWQHISKVNSSVSSGANTVSFNGGDVFSDATLNPVTGVIYGSYGTGEGTITNTGGAIASTNASGFVVQNLIIQTPTNSVNNALSIVATSASGTIYPGIMVSNCYIYGGANGIEAVAPSANADCFSNLIACQLIITNCNTTGFVTEDTGFDANVQKFMNVVFSNCIVANIYGTTTPVGSGNGAVFSNCSNGVCQLSYFHDCGFQSDQSGGGPGGAFPINSYGFSIQHSFATRVHAPQGIDGIGFDIDVNCVNCSLIGNLAYGCDGSGFLINGTGSFVEFNYSINNCLTVNEGEIREFGGTGITIANNTVLTSGPVFNLPNSDSGTVINNILYSSMANSLLFAVQVTPETIVTNNLILPNQLISWNGGAYTSLLLAQQQARQGIGYYANPNFQNPSTPILTSPAMISTLTNFFIQYGSAADRSSLPFLSILTPSQYLGGISNDVRGILIRTNFNIGAVDANWGLGSYAPFILPNPSKPLSGIASASPTGNTRNDFGDYVGWTAMANANMTITSIGRWIVSGNFQSHTLSFYTGAFPSPTLLQSVSINTSGQIAGKFAYVALSPPITVTAGTQITVVSQESNGGDFWYDTQNYTFATDFSSVSSCFNSSGFSPGTANQSFVPVNIIYTKP